MIVVLNIIGSRVLQGEWKKLEEEKHNYESMEAEE